MPGAGSTFSFDATFASVDERADRAVLAGRALVIDAHAGARGVLVERLRAIGLDVREAADWDESLATGAEGAVVFVAANAPPVPGRPAGLAGVTVVAMLPASVAPGVRDAWSRAGAAVVTKPVRESDLRRVLEPRERPSADNPAPSDSRADRAACGRAERALDILLAEDNPVNQRVASAILRRRGHRVTIAEHGRAAVERAMAQTFDVIVMDVQMPEMSGLEAAAVVRAAEGHSGRRVPIVALTAHALAEDRDRCLQTGMDRT